MYAFDPRMGRAVRAQIGDQAAHLIGSAADAFDATVRDARNRTRGSLYELGDRGCDEYVPDSIVAARVRAELGLLVRHICTAYASTVDNRCVTLGGTIEAD